jgi:4-hydroxyphenylpyruvate dioxygenase
MLHSIATVSLSGSLPEKMEACAAAGFDGFELLENDFYCFNGTARDVRKMAADLGLQIMLFQPFRDYEGVPRELWKRNLYKFERKLELTNELGVNKILLCSNASPNTIMDDDLTIDDLGELADIAAKHHIMVGYEGLSWAKYVTSAHHAWRLINAVNHKNLGIILDSFHTLALGDDPATLSGIPANKIVFIQLADAPRLDMNITEWSRHFRCFPGQGELDMASFLAPIIANGYNGVISLEVFNDGFRAAPPKATALDAKRSLLYMEEITRKKLAQTPEKRISPAAKLHIPDLFMPPPSSGVFGGIEFLEFAVDKKSHQSLGKWLTQLGFALRGKHKTKNVSLYQNGGINFVLNAEPNTFAHSYFLAHGVSLCAMGMRVGNTHGALGRALQYGCEQYKGEKDVNLPAIIAPDGSLIYFCETNSTIFATEFDLVPLKKSSNIALNHIDHVALGLPAHLFNTWILFFKTALGLVAENELTLPDPYGLMKSRTLRSTNSTVRIPLNVSENRHTALSQSVSNYEGSGVQHIAFATDDIFAAVEKAKKAGLPLLDIPKNYYDDLALKFDLSDAFMEKLTKANILYDRDATGGELLHAYTSDFANRFSFELLERRGNYQLYGANNVTVRLTALARTRAKVSPFGE